MLPALVILCREILVSGLREYLAGLRVGMPVSRLAKWKTAIQMVAIGFLIVGDAGPRVLPVTAIGESAAVDRGGADLGDRLRLSARRAAAHHPPAARRRDRPRQIRKPA